LADEDSESSTVDRQNTPIAKIVDRLIFVCGFWLCRGCAPPASEVGDMPPVPEFAFLFRRKEEILFSACFHQNEPAVQVVEPMMLAVQAASFEGGGGQNDQEGLYDDIVASEAMVLSAPWEVHPSLKFYGIHVFLCSTSSSESLCCYFSNHAEQSLFFFLPFRLLLFLQH